MPCSSWNLPMHVPFFCLLLLGMHQAWYYPSIYVWFTGCLCSWDSMSPICMCSAMDPPRAHRGNHQHGHKTSAAEPKWKHGCYVCPLPWWHLGKTWSPPPIRTCPEVHLITAYYWRARRVIRHPSTVYHTCVDSVFPFGGYSPPYTSPTSTHSRDADGDTLCSVTHWGYIRPTR